MADDVDILYAALSRLQAKHGCVRMDVDFALVVSIISHCQLALRRPDNKGYSSVIVWKWLDAIIADLEALEPEVGRILRMGDQPQHDVAPPPMAASAADEFGDEEDGEVTNG